MKNENEVLAEFAKKYQQPFVAKKVIVPGMDDVLWMFAEDFATGKMTVVDGRSVIAYTIVSPQNILVSDELQISPDSNEHNFPFKSYIWFPNRNSENHYVLYFHPQVSVDEIDNFFSTIRD